MTAAIARPRRARRGAGWALILAAAACLAPAAVRAAALTIVDADGAGEGFHDPTPAVPQGGNSGSTRGEQRLNVFRRAASIWGSLLASDVTIQVRAAFDPLPCDLTSALLGSAGPLTVHRNFRGAEYRDTWVHQALANKQARGDLSPSADIQAFFNSRIDDADCLGGRGWYYGYDGNHGTKVDLLPVVLHELAHGLGFSTLVDLASGAEFGGGPDLFERFVLDRSLSRHWNELSDEERVASATRGSGVVWDGPVTAATAPRYVNGNDGEGLPLYVPTRLSTGSAVSHWDPSATPDLLMEPAIGSGVGANVDLTRYAFEDLGWYGRPTGASPVATPSLAPRAVPNPFASETTVRFEQAAAGAVELSIVDVGGRLVRRWTVDGVAAGTHGEIWDGRDASGATVPPGLYFARVTTPGAVTRSARIVRVP